MATGNPNGAIRTAQVRTTSKGDSISIPGRAYCARCEDGTGLTRVVPAKRRDESAARAFLVELERRAERVRAGVLSSAEDAISDHRQVAAADRVVAYIGSLAVRG